MIAADGLTWMTPSSPSSAPRSPGRELENRPLVPQIAGTLAPRQLSNAEASSGAGDSKATPLAPRAAAMREGSLHALEPLRLALARPRRHVLSPRETEREHA
jgi:hypothetical protein